MQVETNGENFKISPKQAQYFAIQIYSGIKKYIVEHRAEYEEWLKNNNEAVD